MIQKKLFRGILLSLAMWGTIPSARATSCASKCTQEVPAGEAREQCIQDCDETKQVRRENIKSTIFSMLRGIPIVNIGAKIVESAKEPDAAPRPAEPSPQPLPQPAYSTSGTGYPDKGYEPLPYTADGTPYYPQNPQPDPSGNPYIYSDYRGYSKNGVDNSSGGYDNAKTDDQDPMQEQRPHSWRRNRHHNSVHTDSKDSSPSPARGRNHKNPRHKHRNQGNHTPPAQ